MHHILYMQIIKMINKILFLNTYNNKQIVEIKKKIEIKMILDKKWVHMNHLKAEIPNQIIKIDKLTNNNHNK
jgi:hypothetical protein